jgi:site-specific DNA-methyltransferase (adenine-specific)
MEIDPAYVDVICRRYQEHTGDVPVHESTGQPHDFIQPEGQ